MNVLLVSVTAAAAQASGPTTAAVGAQAASFQEFLGIRYAKQPLRFAPSELADFDGPLERGKYGKICPQPLLPQYVPYKDEIVSEDCHFINVHTPAGAAAAVNSEQEPKKALLPVMVWIHGGGFTGGAGSFYNGSILAANNDVVVVTLNYRLGSLGFISLSELANAGDSNGGLNGVRDQITALQWVSKNIQKFGGDPNQVTVFGESAGSISICTLLVSPSAKGLFTRAILESGPCNGPWSPRTAAESLAGSAAFASAMTHGATTGGPGTVAALRKLDAWSLVNNINASSGAIFGFAMPAPDGFVLTKLPIEYYTTAGSLNVKEVILGGNSFDGLVPFELPPGQPNHTLFEEYTAHWPAAVKAQYPLSRFSGNTNAPLSMVDGDCCVVCAGYDLARLMTAAGATVYVYYFQYGPVCDDEAMVRKLTVPSSGWASHASEIVWVFGLDSQVPDQTMCFGNASEVSLTRTIQEYWTSFGKGGKPVAANKPAWPAHTGALATGQTMVLDLQLGAKAGVKASDCGVVLDALKCGTPPPPPPPPPPAAAAAHEAPMP